MTVPAHMCCVLDAVVSGNGPMTTAPVHLPRVLDVVGSGARH
jgi:hypothetical protein